MKKQELNLPASDWEVEYLKGEGLDELSEFNYIRATEKGTDNGIVIKAFRYDEEGILMPDEFLKSVFVDELEELNAQIPEYYQTVLGDVVEATTFQGRQAAYFLEQKAGETAAILHAAVMDETGYCSIIDVKVEDWTRIANPTEILSYLEGYMVL